MSSAGDTPITTDSDDQDNNSSHNTHFNDLLAARLHRRQLLRGGVGALAAAALGPLGIAGCAVHGDSSTSFSSSTSRITTLGFTAVPKDLADRVVVPAGYTATVIYATGDSIDANVADYKNDGTDAQFSRRAGDHHDAVEYFGLNAAGTSIDSKSTNRGLLAMNHENIAGTVVFMHPNGPTNAGTNLGARPEAEAVKEIEAHGVSIVEIKKASGRFAVDKASPFNRRISGSTPMDISGPLRGNALARTRYSPTGLATRGTVNNCAAGRTPWGTFLTCEENWAGYFRRASTDDAARSSKELTSLLRAGLRQGQAGNYRWTSVVPSDPASTEFSRWDAGATAADATGDFRNAPNTFGWAVEIDPYDPRSTPRKRTALGRFAHEGATCSNPVTGKPLAFYMGDDSRGEYVYKFVSKVNWDAADADRGGLDVGNKYLDDGILYVARFNSDGTGTWLKLDLANSNIANYAIYPFADRADVLVNARIAADAAGATKMDRPEWTAVNPRNGEIYVTMTENPDRGNVGVSSNNNPNPPIDAANPRYWQDLRSGTTNQKGNVNGHIVRLRETAGNASAETFDWDIFLFGSQAKADAGIDDANYQQNVNLSGLSDANDLSKPDGCRFSAASGILWIETDDNTYTDVTNCMLLAAIAGQLGDGSTITVVNKSNGSPNAAITTDVSMATRMGRKMNDTIFKRFLTAPKGSEVTGITDSPDGKALFVNIQHPGENTAASNIGNPSAFESHWPGNGAGIASTYGPGGATARPRSSTVMITKDDGGVVGT